MHKYFLRIAAALAALAVVGCSEDEPANNGDDPAQEEVVDLTDPKGEGYVPSKAAKITEERADELTLGQADFGVRVFDRVAAPGENTVFSPLSLYMAMGALANGAEGQTLDEILAAMGANSREEAVALCARQLGEFTDPAISAQFPNSLKVANSLWVNEGKHVYPSYVAECQKWLDSEVATVDLASTAGVDAINGWISDKTNGLIKNMLTQPYNASTTLATANALYLHSPWSSPFDEELTTDEEFTNADGSKATVEMMHQSFKKTTYFHSEGITAINMKLSDCWGFNMYFLMADNAEADPAECISFETLSDLLGGKGYSGCNLEVALPKFKLEWKAENLLDALRALGIKKAFSLGGADFSLLTPHRMAVSSVIQKATIGIDEAGVEAAAATMTGSFGSNIGGQEGELPTISFNANRPFAFVITEVATGAVLFLGTVNTL